MFMHNSKCRAKKLHLFGNYNMIFVLCSRKPGPNLARHPSVIGPIRRKLAEITPELPPNLIDFAPDLANVAQEWSKLPKDWPKSPK